MEADHPAFQSRVSAGRQLAEFVRELRLRNPLALAIPRGGAVVGAGLAAALPCEFDLLLCRQIRMPGGLDPLGAVAENGALSLNRHARGSELVTAEWLVAERARHTAELARQRRLLREIRPPALIADRSIIILDDGILTGATMTAALDSLPPHAPYEIIVAVPVAVSSRLPAIRRRCDRLVCLLEVEELPDLRGCFEQFPVITETAAVNFLRNHALPPSNGIPRNGHQF